MTLRFPAGLDEQGFLSRYWQREPLLLPNALSHLPELTPAELAGLACEDDIEARLLRSAGPATRWQLQHGPFRDEDFEQLPAVDWTLLVQDVDKFVPEVAALLQQFSFLPAWRIDDVMISYAAPGGTVGPHIDEYDVFLIQGVGSRVWETGRTGGGVIPDLPLRVLQEFDVERRWELNTGDALYLPPGLAHHGYSSEACMTWSVGFRAPTVAELLLAQAEFSAAQTPGRYRDTDLAVDESRDGLISEAAIGRALELLRQPDDTPDDAATWFGQLVTENKPWLQPSPIDPPDTPADFERRLERGAQLQKPSSVRMAYSMRPRDGMLFVDGVAFALASGSRHVAPALCRGDAVSAGTDGDSIALLYRLYCDGKIYFTDDE